MTYEETLGYLFTCLPMFQRNGKSAFKKDLTNTIKLLEFLDNPHLTFKSVHIAGTNGKGTSAHGIAAIMQTAGYKTGLYTSPHLKNFTERIKIDGNEVSQSFVVDFIDHIKPMIEKIKPSFFEITVAMAFEYFAKDNVDIAIIETGLGGRLDSTNVIIPEVSLITGIGYDHMDMLGHTLEEIAGEKAGIIKPKIPVIIGEMLPMTHSVFEQRAKTQNTKLIQAKSTSWSTESLVPDYLIKNIGGIETVIEELINQGWKISRSHLEEGLNNISSLTGLKGRFQVLSKNPLTIADVSHNADGLGILFQQIDKLCEGTLHLIFGTTKEKDLSTFFSLFKNNAKYYWTQSSVPRALPVKELATQGVMNGIEGECFKNVNQAMAIAKKKALPNDTILITGSTFVVGEIENL